MHDRISFLTRARYGVPDPERLAKFYVEALGMSVHQDHHQSEIWRVGYPRRGSDTANPEDGSLWLEFHPSGGVAVPKSGRDDPYWKIAISVENVDLAAACLERRGISTSEPGQFEDVGYLCHLEDPAGLGIEILQHEFHSRPFAPGRAASTGLGQEACLNLVTLRTADLRSTEQFYRERLRPRDDRCAESRALWLHALLPVTSRRATTGFESRSSSQPAVALSTPLCTPRISATRHPRQERLFCCAPRLPGRLLRPAFRYRRRIAWELRDSDRPRRLVSRNAKAGPIP